ncbi:flavodoxin family protein [Litoribacillus peritrichatus]|uniref:NAD(P)H-dependent oxidoreductase n=1 Tax=Litoribacillus peritrichatus TaxID=718191 RepID=A0ABP7MCZ2_9GAMM
MSKKLLIVYHAPSPNTRMLVEALSLTNDPTEYQLSIVAVPALECQPPDVLSSDAIILFTPENLGYMSGGMKDFFDRNYYPCLEKTQGMPFSFVIRAGHDGTGTRKAIETITTGLRWRVVQEPITCRGDFEAGFIDQCEELGQAMAISLEAGII